MDVEQTLSDSCVAARAQIRRFLGSSSAVGGAKVLPPREHLAQCAECNAEYRALVEGVARISHGARDAHSTVVDDDTRVLHARRSFLAADPHRKLRIPRSILPLALIAVFAILIARSGAESLTLDALAGGVFKGASTLEAGSKQALANGEGCSTGHDGRARVERGPNRIEFGPDSSFLIERLDQVAVRMFSGSATVTGDAIVLLAQGALQTRAGSARISIDERGGVVECVSGGVEYTDATGRHALSNGESRALPAPRPTTERE